MDDLMHINPEMFAAVAIERISTAAVRDAKLSAVIKEQAAELATLRQSHQDVLENLALCRDIIHQLEEGATPEEVESASANR